MYKILLVDNDKNIVISLGLYLSNSGYDIIMAGNANEAIELLKVKKDINLIISDINMPFSEDLKFCQYIKSSINFNNIPLLLLTENPENSNYSGFKTKTEDYLSKPINPFELLLRVKALLRINNKLNKKEASQNNKLFNDTKIEINGKDIQFTFTEFNIFYYLFVNQNRFINYQELLSKVLNYPDKMVSSEIIRTHIRKIRLKIEEEPNKPQIIKTISRKGYYLDKSKID